jgi:hypothetical protein
VICGLLQILMVFTFTKDEQSLRIIMDEKASEMRH